MDTKFKYKPRFKHNELFSYVLCPSGRIKLQSLKKVLMRENIFFLKNFCQSIKKRRTLRLFQTSLKKLRKVFFKGTLSRDFLLLVFCHESVSPKPLNIPLGPFQIFWKFAEIFAAQGWPPVSTTPVANLPPVATTLVANNGINIRLQIS